MQTMDQHVSKIVEVLKEGRVAEGLIVGVAVDTYEKGEAIIKRVNEELPGASSKWGFRIIVAEAEEAR